MRTCTYISGRHRAGKRTVATAVRASLPAVSFISGCECWNRYSDDLSFEERLSRTNQDILAALRDSDASDILCEWVPCKSPFVTQMYELATSTNRKFLHAGLTAPASVLQARREELDGDDTPLVDPVPIPDQQVEYDCMVFDTAAEEAACIADVISKWILSNQELKATGELAP